MRSNFHNQLGSRFITFGLLFIQATIGTIAVQEILKGTPGFKSAYAVQASTQETDADDIYTDRSQANQSVILAISSDTMRAYMLFAEAVVASKAEQNQSIHRRCGTF